MCRNRFQRFPHVEQHGEQSQPERQEAEKWYNKKQRNGERLSSSFELRISSGTDETSASITKLVCVSLFLLHMLSWACADPPNYPVERWKMTGNRFWACQESSNSMGSSADMNNWTKTGRKKELDFSQIIWWKLICRKNSEQRKKTYTFCENLLYCLPV